MLLLGQVDSLRLMLLLTFFFYLGLLAWLYLTIRIFRFFRKLEKFCERLLAGNYDTGIKVWKLAQDEIKAMGQLINKVAERLRIYDEQRADKVALHFRVRELIINNSREGIIVADTEKEVFFFNPVARSVFGVNQASFAFASLGKQENNKHFFTLLKAAMEQEKTTKEETRVSIDLLVSKIKKEVTVKIFPLKDRSERVKLVVIFLSGID
jgi:PAS domain-containing protein